MAIIGAIKENKVAVLLHTAHRDISTGSNVATLLLHRRVSETDPYTPQVAHAIRMHFINALDFL